jgi:hypothetical protein
LLLLLLLRSEECLRLLFGLDMINIDYSCEEKSECNAAAADDDDDALAALLQVRQSNMMLNQWSRSLFYQPKSLLSTPLTPLIASFIHRNIGSKDFNPFSIVQAALSNSNSVAADHLLKYGYSIIDNAFPLQNIGDYLEEIRSLRSANILIPNSTHFVNPRNGQLQLLPKSNIFEMEIDYPGIDQITPNLAQLQANKTLINCIKSLSDKFSDLAYQKIKIQVNTGSAACFPLHFDSYTNTDTRQLTAIFYLNENYKVEHGGALILYPFPFQPITIQPKYNRMVLFASPTMLHRVLPSHNIRYTATIWFYSNSNRQMKAVEKPLFDEAVYSTLAGQSQQLDYLLKYLFHPYNRGHLCKLFYNKEWHQSIQQSHLFSAETLQSQAPHYSVPQIKEFQREYEAAVNAALQQHDREIVIIAQVYEKVLARLLKLSGSSSLNELFPLKLAKIMQGGESAENDTTSEEHDLFSSLDWSQYIQYH